MLVMEILCVQTAPNLLALVSIVSLEKRVGSCDSVLLANEETGTGSSS